MSVRRRRIKARLAKQRELIAWCPELQARLRAARLENPNLMYGPYTGHRIDKKVQP